MYVSHFGQTVIGQAIEVERKLGLSNLEGHEERSLISRKRGLVRQVSLSPALQQTIRALGGKLPTEMRVEAIPEPPIRKPLVVRVTPLNKRGQVWGE
jgi:hypothetical protein